MTLAFVVPGLDEAASEKAIAILQNRLSQEQEAALVLKHAHWNVTGPNFIAVHEMLDPEVEAVLAQADETAERIGDHANQPGHQTPQQNRHQTNHGSLHGWAGAPAGLASHIATRIDHICTLLFAAGSGCLLQCVRRHRRG